MVSMLVWICKIIGYFNCIDGVMVIMPVSSVVGHWFDRPLGQTKDDLLTKLLWNNNSSLCNVSGYKKVMTETYYNTTDVGCNAVNNNIWPSAMPITIYTILTLKMIMCCKVWHVCHFLDLSFYIVLTYINTLKTST
jgi:hypothetical protein